MIWKSARERAHPRRSCACWGRSLTKSPTCSPRAGRRTAVTARIPTACTSTAVAGHPQAAAGDRAGDLSGVAGRHRHRPPPARHQIRGRQLGVAHAGRVGHRLAGDARRPRNHAVHLFPAVRRRGSRPHLRRADLRAGAALGVSCRMWIRFTTSSGRAIPTVGAQSPMATCATPRSCSSRFTTSRSPRSITCGSTSICTRPSARNCSPVIARSRRLTNTSDQAIACEKRRFPLLAAYDLCLKCSHLFNLLDSRGAISVTERVGVIARVRNLAVGVSKAYLDQQGSAAAEITPRKRQQGAAD